MLKTVDKALLAQRRKLRCQACGSWGVIDSQGNPTNEAHHIQTQGRHGGDDWWNVLTLCFECHTGADWAWHRNIRTFFEKAPHLIAYLRFIGWEFCVTKWRFRMVHPAYRDCPAKQKPEWKIQNIDEFLKHKNSKKEGIIR